MNSILETFIKQLNSVALQMEEKLQIEESGSEIAWAQGFIAGTADYKNLLVTAKYRIDSELYNTQVNTALFYENGVCLLDLEELRDVMSDVEELTDSGMYKSIKKIWDDTVAEKKDFLFYNSKKGRDLYFCKGWYAAMNFVGSTITKLENDLAKKEKEKKEMLF